MHIHTALDWQGVSNELQQSARRLKNLDHGFAVRKILRNMDRMVSDLSRLEVQMRRSPGHSSRAVDAKREEINTEINNLEQWITMLLLSNQ